MMVEHMKKEYGIAPTDVRYFFGDSSGGVRYVDKLPPRMCGVTHQLSSRAFPCRRRRGHVGREWVPARAGRDTVVRC